MTNDFFLVSLYFEETAVKYSFQFNNADKQKEFTDILDIMIENGNKIKYTKI